MNDETMRGRLQDLSDRKLRTWEDMAREWPSGSTQGINADAFLSLVVEVRKLRDEKNTRAQASAPDGENDRLREMAEHIAASSFPSDDSSP